MVSHWIVEVLALVLGNELVILAVHHLEVVYEVLFSSLEPVAQGGLRVDWLTALEVVASLFLVKSVGTDAVGGRFVNVSEMVRELGLALALVKEVLVLGVPDLVCHTVSNVGAVVPGGQVGAAGLVNAGVRA